MLLRPALACELRGSVLLRLGHPYKPVRVDLFQGEIEVGDCDDNDRAHDLVIDGALNDVCALIASPLTGGLPRPTTAIGCAAIARLVDGRVAFSGPLNLARGLLQLLSAMPESPCAATSPAPSDRDQQMSPPFATAIFGVRQVFGFRALAGMTDLGVAFALPGILILRSLFSSEMTETRALLDRETPCIRAFSQLRARVPKRYHRQLHDPEFVRALSNDDGAELKAIVDRSQAEYPCGVRARG